MTLDGVRIGLWYFQRVSVEDIERHLFRGHMAFHIDGASEHELQLQPYREMTVRWLAATLEVDPDDRLLPLPAGLRPAPGNVPASAWTNPAFWEEQRCRLATTHHLYAQPLAGHHGGGRFAWVATSVAKWSLAPPWAKPALGLFALSFAH